VITDPQAIKFSNERIRPAADSLGKLYYAAKSILNDWYAQQVSTVLPNTDVTLDDGSQTDGRNTVSGADLTNVINRLSEFVADCEADSNAKLNTILKVAVNPQ